MSFQGLGKRLMFWKDNQLVSNFSADIVPHKGDIWDIPLGSHKYDRVLGSLLVEVTSVTISPYPWHIDIDIECVEIKAKGGD